MEGSMGKMMDDYLIFKLEDIDDKENIVRMIPKIIKLANGNTKIGLKYKKKIIFDDNEVKKELKDLAQIITAINKKDKRERYEYIYDKVCENIEQQMTENNYCDFIDNRCIANRTQKTVRHINGCCYKRGEGLCKLLDNGKCKIKNISCSLFMCSYMKKKGIEFSCDKLLLTKYFFNRKERKILKNSFFKSKDEIIDRLLHNND
jgi:hypothetical protein